MSQWQELDMTEKITKILSKFIYENPEKYGGNPWVTAYQIAYEFAEQYHVECKKIGLPVGGKGTGERNSLAQYIAQQLSRNINSKRVEHIEYSFLHTNHINTLSFKYGDDIIVASAPGTKYDVSIYRLKS